MKNQGSSFQKLNTLKVEQIISEKEDLEEGNYACSCGDVAEFNLSMRIGITSLIQFIVMNSDMICDFFVIFMKFHGQFFKKHLFVTMCQC